MLVIVITILTTSELTLKSLDVERGHGSLVPSQTFPTEVSRSADKSQHISPGTGADDPTGLL